MGRRRGRKNNRSKSGRKNPWLDRDIVVWSQRQRGKCAECGEAFRGKRTLAVPCPGTRYKKARCLECAGVASLAFLPAGNAKLTLRASKYSAVRAVVVRKRRKFTERCGILVEPRAVIRACDECRVPIPEASFEPVAGTTWTLAPTSCSGPDMAYGSVQTPKKAQMGQQAAGRNPRQNNTAAYSVESIAALVRTAYPDCSHARALKVARYAVKLPETREILAQSRSADRVGVLVSKYLRRGRTAQHQS